MVGSLRTGSWVDPMSGECVCTIARCYLPTYVRMTGRQVAEVVAVVALSTAYYVRRAQPDARWEAGWEG